MLARIVAQEMKSPASGQVAGAARRGASPARKPVRAARGHGADAAAGLAAPRGERMSKVDTAWLRMDTESNLMMILGVWVLQPGIRRAALCRRVQERLLKYPRFTQRVVEEAMGASWVADPDFDLKRHVVTERLPRKPRGREQDALQERLAQLAVQPFDRRHPLWQFHLVEHYQGGSALMVRIHHCIADGMALLAVTQSLVDGGAPPPRRRAAPAASQEGLEGAAQWIAENLLKPLRGMAVHALDAAGSGVDKSLGLLLEPRQSAAQGVDGSIELARMAWRVISDAAALALMSDDSPTRLKGVPGPRKRVAWCPPIPLDEVKAVGRALNCSINDVLLSCVAGAIGAYLQAHGDEVAGQDIRAMVPVNLRPPGQVAELGNRFGLAPVILPIGLDNPVQRVYEVRRRMSELKGSLQPLLAFGILAIAGLLIKPGQDALLNLFSKKTTAVMTNVPGPRQKLKLCGATIEQNLFWVPQSGSVGLGVSILSYGGGVQFGVISDAALCPDPQKIIDEFGPEFARLAMLTLMLPWGGEV